MLRFVPIILALFVLQTLTGCAAIFNGDRSQVQVNSKPSGAKVQVDGMDYGETPIQLKLDEKKSHVVTITNGGVTKTYSIGKKIGAGWIILDVLGGIIPVVIDAATGAWYNVSPDEINATFK